MTLLLGAIADDFTGATDLANTLVRSGMRTIQSIGVPGDDFNAENADAVIVALKSRMAPVAESVELSLKALDWLRENGARQIIFKYCSTFDSTPKGNIGPVADALANSLECPISIVCPAFPGAGRTIYQGYLFVGEQLLSDSSMQDHPLTPMNDSSLIRLMSAQSEMTVGLVPHNVVVSGAASIATAIDALAEAGHRYAVVDATDDADLAAIGAAAADHRLITGGSGVAIGLPENFRRAGLLKAPAEPETPGAVGRAVVLAGSCSQATRAQIARAREIWPCWKLEPNTIAAGQDVVADTVAWAMNQKPGDPVLIYGSADPAEIARVQERYGRERSGAMVEEAIAAIACELVKADFRRMIVAGGETSGAVVAGLGIGGLRIGKEIAPGVPWTTTLGGPPELALALKSGNFGTEDFFEVAFGMLP